jgi:hypothetical protein
MPLLTQQMPEPSLGNMELLQVQNWHMVLIQLETLLFEGGKRKEILHIDMQESERPWLVLWK